MNRQLIVAKLLKDAENIKLDRNSSYHVSYPEFIEYFSRQKFLDKHNLIIGINFTYGWMPTAFDFRVGTFDAALDVINRVKSKTPISFEDISLLRDFLNGSLVGTSKLLHFISPDTFPIWDSRVFWYLYGLTPFHYRLNRVESYLDYVTFCLDIAKEHSFDMAYEKISQQLYPISRLRALELVMFEGGFVAKTTRPAQNMPLGDVADGE